MDYVISLKENAKSVNYVQISEESYAQLTALEDEVKFLTEKLTSAQSEITTKEELVKQHVKVAEEAVSGHIFPLKNLQYL